MLFFEGTPSCEEILDWTAARICRDGDVLHEILRGEAVIDTIREDIEEHRSFQRMFAVHQNVEDKMHRGTNPITNQ